MRRRRDAQQDTLPSVTVVIPTFRRERALVDAVNSVLREDLGDLEVLVIDDAPDHSARDVVAGIDDGRVRYLTMPTPSGGRPALVRNLGIESARGDVLYFLDDDDTIAPGALPAIVEAFADHPEAGVVFGAVECIGPDPSIRDRYTEWFDWAARTARRVRWSSWLTVGVTMFRGTLIINSCCAIRRALAVELGGYDPNIDVYEDVEFFARGIRRSGHAFVDREVLRYSTGLPSIIHDLHGDNDPIVSSYVEMHRKYRDQHGVVDFQLLRLASRLLPLAPPAA